MWAQRISPAPGGLSARQRRVQRRARQLCFKADVRLAADALFRFSHRATQGKALWSHSVCVWLGSATFIHWAMCDVGIHIPWMAAEATDAPETADELHEAVRAELIAYWAEQLAALPRKSTPPWLPLP